MEPKIPVEDVATTGDVVPNAEPNGLTAFVVAAPNNPPVLAVVVVDGVPNEKGDAVAAVVAVAPNAGNRDFCCCG